MSLAGDVAKGLASNPFVGGALVLAGVGAFVWWKWGDRLKSGFDPTSDQNFAYTGVNQVGSRVSGDRDWTLGGWIYDFTHPPYDPNEGTGGSARPKGPLQR